MLKINKCGTRLTASNPLPEILCAHYGTFDGVHQWSRHSQLKNSEQKRRNVICRRRFSPFLTLYCAEPDARLVNCLMGRLPAAWHRQIVDWCAFTQKRWNKRRRVRLARSGRKKNFRLDAAGCRAGFCSGEAALTLIAALRSLN